MGQQMHTNMMPNRYHFLLEPISEYLRSLFITLHLVLTNNFGLAIVSRIHGRYTQHSTFSIAFISLCALHRNGFPCSANISYGLLLQSVCFCYTFDTK